MGSMYALAAVFVIAIPLTIYQLVDSFKVSYGRRDSGESSVSLYGLSVVACARKCKCSEGCVHVNYNNMLLLCEIVRVPLNRTEDARGYVMIPNERFVDMPTVSTQEDCAINKVQSCPAPISAERMSVLGNMNIVGAKRVVSCTDAYTLVGGFSTTCTDQETWSAHGECVKMSTIRNDCQTNEDCLDDESECRNNKCWCKQRLSHNPATNSCVEICPGAYGTTFQQLIGFKIDSTNLYSFLVNSIEECIEGCVSYVNGVNKAFRCRYVDFDPSKCFINNIQEGSQIFLTPSSVTIFLQRDCA